MSTSEGSSEPRIPCLIFSVTNSFSQIFGTTAAQYRPLLRHGECYHRRSFAEVNGGRAQKSEHVDHRPPVLSFAQEMYGISPSMVISGLMGWASADAVSIYLVFFIIGSLTLVKITNAKAH